MLLQKIKIKGFKSFPDTAELELERGITGIVGPNGCGKSNIADSINWALGEQSPTSLRGKRMEQMIFNGSSSRKALGAAEVTLVLKTNGNLSAAIRSSDEEKELERQGSALARLLESSNGEVTITRRMFRDAQSDYLLNGKPCRLRDIQDLLMGLGIGSRAITIIEQDKINAILNARPVDRRELIEDAAGITKFKLNRHLTRLKLERTAQNLVRIEDLLAEQGVHLRRLRRQASKARRYRRFQAEIREIETALLHARHSELVLQQKESSSKVSALEAKVAEASADLANAESKHAESRQRVDELSAQQTDTRERHYRSSLDIDRDSNRLKHLREGLNNLFKRSEQAAARLREAQKAYKEKVRRLEDTKSSAEGLEAELRAATERLQALKKKAEATGSDLETLRARKEERLNRLADLREELASERSRADALAAEEQRLASAAANATALKEKLSGSISETDDKLAQLEQRLAELDEEIIENAGELQRRVDDRAAFQKEYEAHERRIDSVRRSQGNAEATLEALQEMERRREGVTEAVRMLFDESELAENVKPIGLVADSLEIAPENSKAVIAAYGRLLEAVVVEDDAAAERGTVMLRQREIGRASFVPLSRLPETPSPPGKDDLRSSLKARDNIGKRLLNLFEPAFMAGSVSEALDSSANGDFRLAATAEGFVARNGRVVRGGADAEKAKVFARRSQIEEFQRQAGELEAQLNELLSCGEEMTARLEALDAEMQELRQAGEALRLQRVELAAQVKALTAERERLLDAASIREQEIESLRAKHDEIKQELKLNTDRTQSLEKKIKQLESGLEEFDQHLRQRSNAAGEVRRLETELAAEISAIEERVKANQSNTALLESDIQELLERIASAQDELKLIEEERQQNLQEIESIESGMQEKMESNELLKRSLGELEGRLKEVRIELARREEEVKRYRSVQQELQEELEACRLEARENMLAIEHLKEKASENLQLEAKALEAPAEEQPDGEQIDVEEAQARLVDLKEKLERLGPVNLLASDEFERHQERHRFLSDQRKDVVDSIASLEKVISRIDRVCRKRFSEAFARINENFHKVFRRLFGGGRAELKLEEGDLLEAGIEILVQPPGKRPQSATLLSGGEKSLAAFSLIMAVMQFRPSPFCILDEADAALDEVNTRRIANLLREQSDVTQFILITHNKTTMEIADRLYGVTMEEPGVSKLVSVKFN